MRNKSLLKQMEEELINLRNENEALKQETGKHNAAQQNTANFWATFCDSYAATWMKSGQRQYANAARIIADDIRTLGVLKK